MAQGSFPGREDWMYWGVTLAVVTLLIALVAWAALA